MNGHTWTCPSCGRRVPNRVATCHCGTTRQQADLLAPRSLGAPARHSPRGRRPGEPLPWDVKALLVGMILILGLGLAWSFRAYRPEPITPLLGYVTPTPPPRPRPTPRPTPIPPPPFKLPWWR